VWNGRAASSIRSHVPSSRTRHEDLIREHYYSSIEIINTGANSDQEIGFVAQRNFILNTKVGSLPAQQPITNISETKPANIIPSPKSDVGEDVHDTILEKEPVASNLSENPVRIVKTLREDGTIGYDLMHDEDGLISDGQGSLTLDEANAELRKLEAFSVFESSMSKIKALEESEGVSGSALTKM
jgi:hypothetical protein